MLDNPTMGWDRVPFLAVTAPHVLPFVPAVIPGELCMTHGIDPDPDVNPGVPWVCVEAMTADLRNDGVSAPGLADPKDLAALRQVVTDAQDDGIDLKVVVIDYNPRMETELRDVATEVGIAYPGSTVLVLSPSLAGTYGPSYDRVVLEAGEDVAKDTHGDVVQSAKVFVEELHAPQFPWTPLAIAVVLLVVAATVGTRLLQVWARRAPAASSEASAGEQT